MGVRGEDADRVHAFLVVGADRADDHVIQVAVRGMHAEEGLRRDDGGADVQRGAGQRGHPALVHLHQGADGFLDHGGIEFRDAEVVRGAVEAAGVVAGAEQADLAVGAAERLQAVEDRLAVVQDAGGGVQGERRVRLDARIMPALPGLIVHQEHVVGEDFSERQRLIGGGRLGAGGPGNRDLVSRVSLYLEGTSGGQTTIP